MEVSHGDIGEYLETIAKFDSFARSPRKLPLLEYLIKTEVGGQGHTLKAYNIGQDVFNKSSDFDPSTDSSVRVELSRLRTAIALFEASDMATTALQIEIPVGTYRPKISMRPTAVDTNQASSAKRPDAKIQRPAFVIAAIACVIAVLWVAVAFWNTPVQQGPSADSDPITLVVENFSDDTLGREIANIVKGSFANYSVVTVLDRELSSNGAESFILKGQITPRQGFSRISIELSNLKTSKIVWTHNFRLDDDANLQKVIQRDLNGELYTRLFGAVKRALEKQNPKDLTAEQLFILGTWVSGSAESRLEWEVERVKLMMMALAKDPDHGPAHSVLADKYGFLANVSSTWDTPETIELSRFHATRAVELSPLDANAMFNVAQSYWHTGRHSESQSTFERVTELDSGNSLAQFFSLVVPYWCSEVPDTIMSSALAFDRQLSADDPIRWIVLTWIAKLHANRGEYDLGLRAVRRASQIFQVGYTYMELAMLLNKLGRPDAAAEVILQQRHNWPSVDAAHYSESAMPRLCKEQKEPETFLSGYSELTEAMVGKLDKFDKDQ